MQRRDKGAGEGQGTELPGMWIQGGAALGSRPLRLNKRGMWGHGRRDRGERLLAEPRWEEDKDGKRKQLSSEVWAPASWGGPAL